MSTPIEVLVAEGAKTVSTGTTAQTTLVTLAGASLTASTPYLILATAYCTVETTSETTMTGNNWQAWLEVGGTAVHSATQLDRFDGDNYLDDRQTRAKAYQIAYLYDTPATPLDVTIEVTASGAEADGVTAYMPKIVAINCDDIGTRGVDWDYDENTTSQAATLQGAEITGFTPTTAQDHVAIYSTVMGTMGFGNCHYDWVIDATTETRKDVRVELTGDDKQAFSDYWFGNLAASAHTIDFVAAGGNTPDHYFSSVFVASLAGLCATYSIFWENDGSSSSSPHPFEKYDFPRRNGNTVGAIKTMTHFAEVVAGGTGVVIAGSIASVELSAGDQTVDGVRRIYEDEVEISDAFTNGTGAGEIEHFNALRQEDNHMPMITTAVASAGEHVFEHEVEVLISSLSIDKEWMLVLNSVPYERELNPDWRGMEFPGDFTTSSLTWDQIMNQTLLANKTYLIFGTMTLATTDSDLSECDLRINSVAQGETFIRHMMSGTATESVNSYQWFMEYTVGGTDETMELGALVGTALDTITVRNAQVYAVDVTDLIEGVDYRTDIRDETAVLYGLSTSTEQDEDASKRAPWVLDDEYAVFGYSRTRYRASSGSGTINRLSLLESHDQLNYPDLTAFDLVYPLTDQFFQWNGGVGEANVCQMLMGIRAGPGYECWNDYRISHNGAWGALMYWGLGWMRLKSFGAVSSGASDDTAHVLNTATDMASVAAAPVAGKAVVLMGWVFGEPSPLDDQKKYWVRDTDNPIPTTANVTDAHTWVLNATDDQPPRLVLGASALTDTFRLVGLNSETGGDASNDLLVAFGGEMTLDGFSNAAGGGGGGADLLYPRQGGSRKPNEETARASGWYPNQGSARYDY